MGKQMGVWKVKLMLSVKNGTTIKAMHVVSSGRGTQAREARRCLHGLPVQGSQSSASRLTCFDSLKLWSTGLGPETPGDALGPTWCRVLGG